MKVKRIKVRYLLVILFLFIGVIYFFQGYRLNDIQMNSSSVGAENKRLKQFFKDQDYEIFSLVQIKEGMSTGGLKIKTSEAEKTYERFVEFKYKKDKYKDYEDYVMNVSFVQWFAGNGELAKEIINLIDVEALNKDEKDKYYMIQAGYELTYHRIDKVIEYINLVENPIYMQVTEDIKEFINTFYKIDIKYKRVKRRFGGENIIINGFSNIYDYNEEAYGYRHNKSDKKLSKGITVKGRVTINDKPVPGVFLYPNRDYSEISSNECFESEFESEFVITDVEGYYVMDSIQKDDKIGMMIPWQLIDDKQWKETNNTKINSKKEKIINYEFYNGARFTKAEIKGDTFYYEIEDPKANKNRSYDVVAKDTDSKYDHGIILKLATIDFNKMKGEIPLKELILNSKFSFPNGNRKDILNITRFIEPLYLTGTYYFDVRCYEENQKKSIYNGIFTDRLSKTVYYKGADSYNEGDQLIEDRKVEEAMKWYEKNPSEHNLKVLVALYSKGYIAVDVEHGQRLKGADKEKAIKYFKILTKVYGEPQNSLYTLRYLYKDIYDFENERKIIELILDKEPSDYTYIHLGMNSINMGHFNEGLKIIKEHLGDRIDKEWYYFPCLILSNQISNLPQEYKDNLNKIEGYEEFYKLINGGNYIEAWNLLKLRPDSDSKVMYRLLMLDSLDLEEVNFKKYKKENGMDEDLRFSKCYVAETVKITDPKIRSILKLLKEEYNWFY